MALPRWLERVRHRPGPGDADSGPLQHAELLEAFRAAPGDTDLRPVTKAMSRDVSGWILGHPAVRTAEDARALRAALLAREDLAQLIHTRLTAQAHLLTEALTEDPDVPPLYLVASMDKILSGDLDSFLHLLPPGSAMQMDVVAATHHPELSRRAIAHLHGCGVRAALSGLLGDGTEDAIVRELAPDVLMLDVATPLDYRDRLTQVARLRAEVGRHRAELVVCGVATAVDEWAGNVCGADHLTGPLYDNADLSALATRTLDADSDQDLTPYEQAAARHPSHIDTLGAVLDRARVVTERVCAGSDHADVYVAYREIMLLPAAAASLIAAMVEAGAAVTVLAPAFEGLARPGLSLGPLRPDEPLAQGWVFVALLNGEGHVIAAVDLGDETEPMLRRHAYVDAEDRELALRIANRISQRASPGP